MNEGVLRPFSYAESVGREVPPRRAISCWLKPAAIRARSIIVSDTKPLYLIGYSRGEVERGGRTWRAGLGRCVGQGEDLENIILT